MTPRLRIALYIAVIVMGVVIFMRGDSLLLISMGLAQAILGTVVLTIRIWRMFVANGRHTPS